MMSAEEIVALAPHPLPAAIVASFGVAAFALTYGVAVAPSREARRLGSRGLERQRAIADGGWFSLGEPLLRWLGVRVSRIVPEWLRARLDRRIVRAGDYLGVTPDEYVALVLVGGAAGALGGALHVFATDSGAAAIAAGALLGAFWVNGRFDARIHKRARELTHGLPYVTDLLALGMTAGLDFPGAVKNVVARSSDRRDALTGELERVLRELALGHTRKHALEQLALRAAVPSVTEFVQAVVQAEERGSPIVDVLVIQAQIARQKRTAIAEERTSRAHLAMFLPLILLLLSTLTLLMVPLVLKLVTSFDRFQ
jgi:tight adherence protein C